ncbi:unnamed protein product [Adineta steineri]|uniref:Uncharacterized protein n=1 Tax=Adineta steineri TaxID=433720 RepID=A0A815JJG3_9BILA|nr:unnamed protein product [Adineta steineri]CAF1607396.1 unnamed protein product [Adineta steineri]
MPRNEISDITKERILQFLQKGYSQFRIVNILKRDGISIAQSSVSRINRSIDRQKKSKSKIKICRRKLSETASNINKVIAKTDVEDPPTQ